MAAKKEVKSVSIDTELVQMFQALIDGMQKMSIAITYAADVIGGQADKAVLQQEPSTTEEAEPVVIETVVEQPVIEQEPAEEYDLKTVKLALNHIARSKGHPMALEILAKYADGSQNPADIPAENYGPLVEEVRDLTKQGKPNGN